MKRRIVPALLALLTLSACVTTTPAPVATNAAYDASIYQAAVFRPENLRPLKAAIPDANGEVLVTTVTGPRPWSTGSQTIPYDTWVSLVPEVKDKCRGFSGDLAMYLRQIIGLKPDQNVVQFITFRAKTTDMFRPTPDPRIDTEYPCLDPVAKTDCNVFPKDVDPRHKQWMAETFLTVQIPNGYPWTHLGYTYNWGPGDRYGASEYLVRGGSSVVVTEVTPIANYCR